MTGVNGIPLCHWNTLETRQPPMIWSSSPCSRELPAASEGQFVDHLTYDRVGRIEVRQAVISAGL